MYMNYFIEQEYGLNYYLHADEVVDLSKNAARSTKSSYRLFRTDRLLDQPADQRPPNFNRVLEHRLLRPLLFRKPVRGFVFFGRFASALGITVVVAKRFMKWFNRERTKTVLTFPVETMAFP